MPTPWIRPRPATHLKSGLQPRRRGCEAQAAKLRHQVRRRTSFCIENSQLETAARINDWLNSPGLQPPIVSLSSGRCR